ncbi:MAG: histidine phosphatase family protein [Cyclobacteriaceae bacterium]
MKKLYLVRHAKSSWDYPQLSDRERPLNKRGKRDAPKMAAFISEIIPCPELLLSSDAVRAHRTAIAFAEAFGMTENDILKDEILYHASAPAWEQVVSSLSDGVGSAMLFGHNPGLTNFVNQIANMDIYNIPTCGVAGLSFRTDSWLKVSGGNCKLDFYHFPKGLKP